MSSNRVRAGVCSPVAKRVAEGPVYARLIHDSYGRF